LRKEVDAEFLLVPFELRPDMPEEGYSQSELEVAGTSSRVEDHIARLAAKDGFAWANPPFLPKTHKALTLGEIARDQGVETHWRMHQAIFGAYLGEGHDIGSESVLLDIAKEEGFDPEGVAEAIAGDAFGERLHQFRHVGMHLGIEATPAALICNELLIGSRPYGVLKDAVDRCLVNADNIAEEAANG
jgi:predicted DsbA family dithiol-disulfide isomerase